MEVVAVLALTSEVHDRCLAALQLVVPSVTVTLAQLAVHLSDPMAVERAAVHLVERAKGLTLGDLVDLSSGDEKVSIRARWACGDCRVCRV
jgi:hypothetical protein